MEDANTTAILVTLVAYKIVLIGFGFFAQRRTRNAEDFFLGGRRVGPLISAISASASSSSAWTLMGVSGAAYAWGLGALWIFPACVGGFVLNWVLLAPALGAHSQKTGALTVTQVLADGHDAKWQSRIRILASCIVLLCLGTYVASQFQGAGKTFATTFNLSMESSITLGALIVVFYTMMGGYWAVSLTDTLQGLLMALTAVLLPVAALWKVGGLGPLFAGLGALGNPELLSLTRAMQGPAALGFVLGLLGIGLGYPGQPHVVNRFMAMRQDPDTLRRARIYAICWALVVYGGMLILGWSGRLLVPALGDQEVIFIAATKYLFSPVIAGIMLAAVLSAIMSTADSQLLVAASSITHDLRSQSREPAHLLRESRLVVFLVSAFAVLGALYGDSQIFSKVLFAWGGMGAAFGPLLLVRVLKGPINAPATFGAMLAGFVLTVVAYSLPELKGGLMERIVPFAVALLIANRGTEPS